MRIFRRRKKDESFQGPPIVDAEPLPDIVYQMGAEAAVRYVRMRAGSPNPHDPMFIEATGGVHEVPDDRYRNDEGYYEEPKRRVLKIKRPKASQQHAQKPPKEGYFVRAGSPAQFQQYPPGTPVHHHRRAASPDFAQQERVGSPYLFAQQQRVGSPAQFGQNARPGSPEMMRRVQRAQHSQELQRAEKEQRRQQEMMMAGAMHMAQPYPYGQQVYYPNMQPFPGGMQMYQYY